LSRRNHDGNCEQIGVGPRSINRVGLLICWGVTLSAMAATCLGGCRAAEKAAPPANAAAPRYQFEKDAQGRLLRLDTATGEVTLVEPASTPASTPAVETTPRPAVPAPTRTARDASGAGTCPDSGTATVTLDALDVFGEPKKGSVPIASLPRGTEITVLEPRGEWRLVRFADPQSGTRTGYIPCSLVVVPPR
jgi:hypothetical protein